MRNQIELWWQDEARVGPKNKIARRWARRGTRPRAPHDQRTSSVYIFGAVCPQQGKGAALVLPRCDTQAMSLHLAEVAQSLGADGRVPRLAQRRVISFFCPIRASSANQISITLP